MCGTQMRKEGMDKERVSVQDSRLVLSQIV